MSIQNWATPYPSAAAAVVLTTIVSSWDCGGHLLPGPLPLPLPLTGGSTHTPSKSGHIPPLPKTLPGLPLTCCQCQDPDDDLGGPSASGLPVPCVRLSDFISKHSQHIPASGPLHLLSTCSRTLPRYPCGLVPLQVSAPGLCFLSASFPDLPVWKDPSSPGSVSPFATSLIIVCPPLTKV